MESRRVRATPLEAELMALSQMYPRRAARWSKALWEYADWLERISEDDPGPVCPTCGQPLPDDTEND